MKLIIFLIYTPLVCTEIHTFITTYTGVTGIKGIPEFFASTTLDGHPMDYYDSISKELRSKQNWLKEFESTDMWKEDTEIRRHVEQIYKVNIIELMKRFGNFSGIHTYQRMYGCRWDSETNKSEGFDMYGYDGEDFITLDLIRGRYTTSVPQANNTVKNWNNNLEYLLYYLKYECLYWLKHFLLLANGTFNKAIPEVSLLQKNPWDPVVCHATGFLPKSATIMWMKNGQKLSNTNLVNFTGWPVKLSELLQNEDGTFKINASLLMTPEEWKKDQFMCVVEHKSWTEKIQKILMPDEIMRLSSSDYKESAAATDIVFLVWVPLSLFVVGGAVCVLACVCRRIKSTTFVRLPTNAKDHKRKLNQIQTNV